MGIWGKDFRIKNKKEIGKTLILLNSTNVMNRLVPQMKGRVVFSIKGRALHLIVSQTGIHFNDKYYPPEFAIYFNGSEHRVKIVNHKIICDLETLIKLHKFLDIGNEIIYH